MSHRLKSYILFLFLLITSTCLALYIGYAWGTNALGAYSDVSYMVLQVVLIIISSVFIHFIIMWQTRKIEKIYDLSINPTSFIQPSIWEDPGELGDLARSVKKLQEQLSKGENLRNQLVSDVAHELRTPLAILRGQIESMNEGAYELSQANLIPMLDEIKRMSRLIQDLRQLSLAESGNLVLDRQWLQSNSLIDEVVRVLEFEAEEKGIKLTFTATEEIEIYCDYSRIKQVLINLIGNSVRYTPENGEVRISLAKDQGVIQIKIADNGPGIPPDKLPYIFHRFYRIEDSRNRQFGGMGLGLAIAKEFVTAHGGHITVESELEKGSTFTIVLPIFPLG